MCYFESMKVLILLLTILLTTLATDIYSPFLDFEIDSNVIHDVQEYQILCNIKTKNAFLIVWYSPHPDYTILAKIFDLNGTSLTPFITVNDDHTYNQDNQLCAMLDNDTSFVIAWKTSDPSALCVYAKVFYINGTVLRNQFQVNPLAHTNVGIGGLIAAPDQKSFLIAWGVHNPYDLCGIYAKVYDSKGVNITDSFLVDTTGTPGITTNLADKVLFGWRYGNSIYAKIMNWNGGSVVSTFEIRNLAYNFNLFPLENGNSFAVISTYYNSVPSSWNPCYLKIFNSNGVARTSDILVINGSVGNWFEYRLSLINETNLFIVVSSFGIVDSSLDTVGFLYDSNGQLLKSQFLINTYTTGDQFHADVAVVGDGSYYIVVWLCASRKGVYGRYISKSGAFLTSEFRMSVPTDGNQYPDNVYSFDNTHAFVMYKNLSRFRVRKLDVYCNDSALIISCPNSNAPADPQCIFRSCEFTCLASNTICNLCSPSNSSCQLCQNKPIYHLSGNNCFCPHGSSYSSASKQCLSDDSKTYLAVNTSNCDIRVTASLPTQEDSFYSSKSVDWTVTTNSTNATLNNLLQAYVSGLKTLNIIIPFEYLESSVTYTFQVSRYTIQGTIVTNQTSVNLANCRGKIYCSASVFSCRYCLVDSDCNLEYPGLNYKCNVPSSTCHECVTNTHCSQANPARPFCDSSKTCIQCSQNSDCASRPGTPTCDLTTKTCVQCLSNSNCSVSSPVCDTSNKVCVECLLNSHCPLTRPYCYSVDSQCKGCLDNSHCPTAVGETPQFCTLRFICYKEPTFDFFGPEFTNGEFNIHYFYVLKTTANRLEYNVTWTVSTSSSSASKMSNLIEFLNRANETYLEIPYIFLEKGAEYNITVTYADIFGTRRVKTFYTKPVCPQEKFHVIGQGCVGNCSKGCFVCDNPVTCITCAPFAVLNATSLNCDVHSSIKISTTEKLSPKLSNIIVATINQEELGYFDISYKWSLVSSSQVIWQNTSDYMKNQSNYIIYLPGTYLQQGVDYKLYASYLNFMGQNVSNSIDLLIGSNKVPAIQIDGGSYQVFKRSEDNTIKLFTQEQSSGTFTAIWMQTGGPTVTAKQPSNKNSMWFTIPSCALKEGSTYQFKVTYFVDSLESMNAVEFVCKTMNDSITVEISNGNRSHPSHLPLSLNSEVYFDTPCPDVDKNLLYKWSCLNATKSPAKPCNDDLSLFGTFSTSPNLIVPQSTFKIDDILIFTSTVSKNDQITEATSQINIASPTTLIVRIKCQLSECTKYYSNQDPLLLYADIEGENNLTTSTLLNFKWTMTPFLNFVTLGNKFFLNENNTLGEGTTLKISIQVSNSTHQGDCFLTLRYNNPPTPGDFIVTPDTGEALSTIFSFSAPLWKDDDVPLKYQYFYQGSQDGDWRSLGDARLHPDLTTLLPGKPPSETINIKVMVYDNYQGKSSLQKNVTVTNQANSIENLQSKIRSVLSSTPDYDPSQMAKSLSLISSQLLITESNININGCPDCSGHGNCLNSVTCICDPGWASSNCNISNTTMASILDTKLELLSKFDEQFSNTTDPVLQVMVVSALKDLTKGTEFNNPLTITKTETLLEKKLDLLNPDINLSTPQKKDLSDVLSNLIKFRSTNDCQCRDESCHAYAKKVEQYFGKMGGENLKFPNLGASNTDFTTPTYDYTIKQVSICKVGETELHPGESKQKIKLSSVNQNTRDCTEIAIITVFAMPQKTDLFSCSPDANTDAPKNKSTIGVSITLLSSGIDISNEFSVLILNPASSTCPGVCNSNYEDDALICVCLKAIDFNPSEQLKTIFSFSDIKSVFAVEALTDWNPATSPIFWFEVGICAWFGITLFLLKLPKFKALSLEELIEKPTVKRVMIYNFVSENDMLSIYYIQDEAVPKKMRLVIYFQYLVLLGLFNAIFGKVTFGKSVLEMILNLQIIIVLLPYWTLVPIDLFINYLIKKSLRENKGNKKDQKIVQTIILGILAIISVGALLSTFILIGVNNDMNWEIKWIQTMMINFAVDFLIFPAIKVAYTMISYYLFFVKSSKNIEGLKKAKPVIRASQILPETRTYLNLKDEHHDHDHETHPQTPGHDTPKTLISQTLILHDKDEDHEKAKPLDKESKANPQNKQLEILTNPFGPKEPIEKEKDKERENITKIVKQPSLKSDKKKTETVIQIEKQKTTNLDDLKIEDFHTTHNADTHSDHQIDHNDTHGLLKKPTWHYY